MERETPSEKRHAIAANHKRANYEFSNSTLFIPTWCCFRENARVLIFVRKVWPLASALAAISPGFTPRSIVVLLGHFCLAETASAEYDNQPRCHRLSSFSFSSTPASA